jgi:hypothetical protein
MCSWVPDLALRANPGIGVERIPAGGAELSELVVI